MEDLINSKTVSSRINWDIIAVFWRECQTTWEKITLQHKNNQCNVTFLREGCQTNEWMNVCIVINNQCNQLLPLQSIPTLQHWHWVLGKLSSSAIELCSLKWSSTATEIAGRDGFMELHVTWWLRESWLNVADIWIFLLLCHQAQFCFVKTMFLPCFQQKMCLNDF